MGEGTDTTPDSDAGRLFRRVGERQYLWNILEIENPWRFCNNKQRRASWTRAARKVLKPGLVDVTDENGKMTVEVDVVKDRVSFGVYIGWGTVWTLVSSKHCFAERWCIQSPVVVVVVFW